MHCRKMCVSYSYSYLRPMAKHYTCALHMRIVHVWVVVYQYNIQHTTVNTAVIVQAIDNIESARNSLS